MRAPAIVRTVEALRAQVAAWRAERERVALVPTMGALHEGHLALVRKARENAGRTIVSIFVNPTQFAPSEDFAAYPRTFENDCALLAAEGADLVYAPTAATVYPAGFSSAIQVGGPALAGLEDAFRPQFFAGVATVVAKLLLQSAPDDALFGEKDYQQLLVVRRMAADLDLPVRIIGAETVREPDGLARSSRNVYLSAAERAAASALPGVLAEGASALRQDGVNVDAILDRGRQALGEAGFIVDYLALRDAGTLAPVRAIGAAPLRLLVAGRLGSTRLIDNWAV